MDSDDSQPTFEELLQRNKDLEHKLRKYKKKQKEQASANPAIKPIIRPRGEAGSRKRGFVLYEAMRMSDLENGPVVYDRMRHYVRASCIKVGLNSSAYYKNLDHAKLGQVFLLVRNKFPYLTAERFPHNWAIADMVKGYIAGTRKVHNKEMREEANEQSQKAKASGRMTEDEQSDSSDTDKENVDPSSSTTQLKKQSKEVHRSNPRSQKTATKPSKRTPELEPDDDDEHLSDTAETLSSQKVLSKNTNSSSCSTSKSKKRNESNPKSQKTVATSKKRTADNNNEHLSTTQSTKRSKEINGSNPRSQKTAAKLSKHAAEFESDDDDDGEHLSDMPPTKKTAKEASTSKKHPMEEEDAESDVNDRPCKRQKQQWPPQVRRSNRTNKSQSVASQKAQVIQPSSDSESDNEGLEPPSAAQRTSQTRTLSDTRHIDDVSDWE